jgi:putative transposase
VCYSIMSNHFHAILYKITRPLFRITQSIKSTTGIQANRILERTNGEKFWHRETYDRIIRDRAEFIQKIHYTLNNPVKVGLVKNWRDWEFNYLNPEFEEYAAK